MQSQRYCVLADYDVNDPHPLKLEADRPVEILRTDTSWPGWVWIRSDGQTGWIPETHLSKATDDGATHTVALFDGTELSARHGELLEAHETAPGWIYATSSTGAKGWFPLFNLKPVRDT